MNHPAHQFMRPHSPRQHGHRRHWLKDLQFAVGVTVAIGGAAVLLSEAVRLFV